MDRFIRDLIAELGPMSALPIDPRGPTDAMPGSKEKIKVLAERLNLGYAPHHPDDRLFWSDDLD